MKKKKEILYYSMNHFIKFAGGSDCQEFGKRQVVIN